MSRGVIHPRRHLAATRAARALDSQGSVHECLLHSRRARVRKESLERRPHRKQWRVLLLLALQRRLPTRPLALVPWLLLWLRLRLVLSPLPQVQLCLPNNTWPLS